MNPWWPARLVGAGLLLCLSVATSAADPAAAGTQAGVEITWHVLGQAAVPASWNIVLRPLGDGEGPVVRQSVGAEKPLVLELPAGSNWEVSADLPGFWVPRKKLVMGHAGQRSHLDLELWPLGTISGRVELSQKDIKLPREVVVKTMAVPAFLRRPPVPPGALDCPVDKQGNWSCSLPSGVKFDLVITADGFTPHYRWEVEVKPARILSLGTFQLSRGSSVAGWVAVEGGAIDPEHCVARLVPLAACDADLKSLAKLDQVAVERPVGKDGFLQIAGISPGNYSLEVRQPGLAQARVANIRVEPQLETFLRDPLVLTHPIALEVDIVPALDERGEPWRAQVLRRVEDDVRPASLVFDGPASLEGHLTVSDQAPGLFSVDILDSQGNRVHSEPERQVDSGSRLTIELSRIAIDGRLRLGNSPLAGTLWFGGQYGARRVKMEADVEGRFTGVLPAEGLWIVDVDSTDPAFHSRTRTQVQPDRSGRATLSIDLPDTRVFGRVVDERGEPVPKAAISLAGEVLDQHVQADATGSFDVRGLPPSALALMATDGKARQSERTVLNLVEGRSVGPVELRLRPIKHLSGTVQSSRGPVAGARVVVRAYSPTVGGGEASTGPEGTFSLEIPANIAAGTALVKAPGFGTKVFPFSAEEKPLVLTVSEAAGEILIDLPRSATDLYRENLSIVLFQDDLEVPVSMLRAGEGAQVLSNEKPVLRLASLAPGRYSACLSRKQVALKGSALEPGSKAGMVCDSGQLAAGATLDLTLREGSDASSAPEQAEKGQRKGPTEQEPGPQGGRRAPARALVARQQKQRHPGPHRVELPHVPEIPEVGQPGRPVREGPTGEPPVERRRLAQERARPDRHRRDHAIWSLWTIPRR